MKKTGSCFFIKTLSHWLCLMLNEETP